jgi:hypothetical protein
MLKRPVQGNCAEDLGLILVVELFGAIDEGVGELGVLVVEGEVRR